MIEVRNISKFYAGKRAVDKMSFKIEEGEIVGLLGLNGAGKSTVLKILGCFLLPSQGEAFLGGHSVLDAAEKVRRLIGYLPDTPPLYNEMTVASYLKFVAKLKEVPQPELGDAVDRAVEKTSLQEVLSFRLSELSHGFRQRVGIAQAIVHNPKILIFDEPINGLDPIQIVDMRDLILSLRSEHTVILSSHILSEITKTCDRILVIDQGQLVAEGSERQLRDAASQNLAVEVELKSVSETLLDAIKGHEAVSRCTVQKTEDASELLKIDLERDVRSELAKIVVANGGDLLRLNKQDAELESLFVKLIRRESPHV